MSYQPPFDIILQIINQISSIAEQIGRLDSRDLSAFPQLRKQNRIRTIQRTLAIEGNTLSLEQVTAILEGKRVLGQWNPIFFLLPIESLIKDEQARYCQTLEQADQAANSTIFIVAEICTSFKMLGKLIYLSLEF